MRRRVWRSISVHCLFLISADLRLFSRAGRDDTDDFFATIVLPIHMNNQQHGVDSRFNASRANRMPALFLRFPIKTVPNEAVFVLESQRRQLKRYSIVF